MDIETNEITTLPKISVVKDAVADVVLAALEQANWAERLNVRELQAVAVKDAPGRLELALRIGNTTKLIKVSVSPGSTWVWG
jgi:hypothetical protein